MFSWILAAALAMPPAAVSATIDPVPQPVLAAPSTLAPDPIPQEQVMALPPELRARAQQVILEGDPAPTQRFQRLMSFVVDQDKLGMTYQEDATYTVAEAYTARQANCLSFTLLVLALAKEAGLQAYPQEVGETLSWREVDGTIYRDNHINAGVSIGSHRYTIDPAADLIFLPRPPVAVSHERLLAHYYNNIAVDRLQAGRMADAINDMAKALALDPSYATLWSNAGVIYLHNGDIAGAEQAYAHALSLDPIDASALFNMVQLLQRRHDPRLAEYRQRLARIERKDPLQQFLQALDYEHGEDFPRAVTSMRRAIQLKPDEPRFYAALARIYQRMGDLGRARSALTSAQSHSSGKARDHYRAQRDLLQQTASGPSTPP